PRRVRHARLPAAGRPDDRLWGRGGGLTARVLPADDPAAVAEAARLLRSGGVLAFPTETVYGLGADAFNPTAVARVFEVKARPSFDPLIVHVADADEVVRVARGNGAAGVDSRVALLAERFWPGPLTLVLPRQPAVPDLVGASPDAPRAGRGHPRAARSGAGHASGGGGTNRAPARARTAPPALRAAHPAAHPRRSRGPGARRYRPRGPPGHDRLTPRF